VPGDPKFRKNIEVRYIDQNINIMTTEVNQFDEKGQKHGIWETYREEGQLWYRVNCIHGKKEGLAETFYRNGQICVREYYVNDVKHGPWEYFSENGQPTNRMIISNGKANGISEGYSKDGTLEFKGMMVDDVQQGLWIENKNEMRYYINGKDHYSGILKELIGEQ